MKITNDHLYESMGGIGFNNKHFIMFKDATGRMAFLELDENNKFHYPELRDVLAMTELITTNYNNEILQPLILDRVFKNFKRYKFIPKVIIGGTVVVLSAAMLLGTGPRVKLHQYTPLKPSTTTSAPANPGTSSSTSNQDTTLNITFEDDDEVHYKLGPNGELIVIENTNANGEELGVPERTYEASDEIEAKYLQYLSPADDQYDWKWENDYQESSVLKFTYTTDSKGYDQIFEVVKPTQEQIYRTIDNNSNLSTEYKNFVKEFVADWLELYPDSDLSVLNYNLQTLRIEKMTDKQIQQKALNMSTVACYVNSENLICINENSNVMDKTSNDYITLVHELLHATRTCRSNINGREVTCGFYKDTKYGLYEDEVLCTWFAYQLQQKHCPELNNRSIYYILQSSIYRDIIPNMNYDGADYMNHSINHFVDRLQDYFDEQGIDSIPAYHFVNLIDSEALMHYSPYITSDYTNFTEAFRVIAQNYCINHASEYASEQELFDAFWEDITYNLGKLSRPYEEITPENFRGYFTEYYQQYADTNVNTQAIRK